LIANQGHGAARIVQVAAEMLQDAAALAHAARGNDYARFAPLAQLAALVGVADVADLVATRKNG